MQQTYYPKTNEGRADWWQNITDNQGALGAAGFNTSQVTTIATDAAWGVYLYRTVRTTFETFTRAIVSYADGITDGSDGGTAPAAPTVPAWPAQPGMSSGINAGLEKRREKWVQSMKGMTGYNDTLGQTLGVIGAGSNFDPATYQPQFFDANSPSACTVAGKFRKAGGNIDGINLYGRRLGTTAWGLLGRYTATPCTATVHTTTPDAPQEWEFQARAVKRDVELGVPSDIVAVIIRC